MPRITAFRAVDVRYDLQQGAGSDAVHTDPQYGYGVTLLETDAGITGSGLNYTLGGGTNLVCEAIKLLVEPVIGRDIAGSDTAIGRSRKTPDVWSMPGLPPEAEGWLAGSRPRRPPGQNACSLSAHFQVTCQACSECRRRPAPGAPGCRRFHYGSTHGR